METLKPKFMIELTISDGCNKNCRYCFERIHKHIPNPEEEQRQLELIKDACETMDTEKYSGIHISFWGGEPFINPFFMLGVIETTYQFQFVDYHVYTNGTLVDTIKQFFDNDIVKNVYDRFHVQLSYDGEPHNSIMRGYAGDDVFITADFLKSRNINFDFKATLSFEMLESLPSMWDDFLNLNQKYDSHARYGLTLDTTNSCINDNQSFEIWKKVILEVAKKEYKFILEHGYPLSNIFEFDKKLHCNINDSVFMHSDGSIYVCHGCPYSDRKNALKTGTTKNIKSLFDVCGKDFDLDYTDACKICGASYCAVCHVTMLKDKHDIHSDWSSCISENMGRCKYYKYLGYISKLLEYALMCERTDSGLI